MIVYINNGVAENNHYATQFSNLFPIIVEIVISIVLTEEGNVLVPRKFLWRYFQIFEVPLLLLFLKKYNDMEIPTWIWKVYGLVFGYLAVYYVYIGTGQRTSIIDAPVYLLMENYTNVDANGLTIQADVMGIANYWEENYDAYEKVYFVKTERDRYEGNVYAYFPIEIYKISENELDTIQESSLIILSKSSETPKEIQELNLDTEMLRVMVAGAGDKQCRKE